MAKVRVHPIQLQYAHDQSQQTCKLCGEREQWTAQAQPTVQGPAYDRTLHLIHLVKSHLAQLQETFSAAERKQETTVEDEPVEE
jgi:hypothetical protein